MKKMTKSEMQIRIDELESALATAVDEMDRCEIEVQKSTNKTGRALGRLRWRVAEHLNLANDARTIVLAEIDSMIDNL